MNKKRPVSATRARKLAKVEVALATPISTKRKARHKGISAEELKARLLAATPLPPVGEKPEHPERKASAPIITQIGDYATFRDNERRYCIRLAVGTKWTEFIPMCASGLTVERLMHEVFNRRFQQQQEYPLDRAVRHFAEAANSFGYSAAVQQHLEAILATGKISLTKENVMTEEATKVKPTTKKTAAKKAAKPAKVFDAAKLTKPKGNPAALKKARAARAGGTVKYAGKKIKNLVKSAEAAGLRAGTARAAMLEAALKAKSTDDVLGKTVTVAGEKHTISGANLAFMIERKYITLV